MGAFEGVYEVRVGFSGKGRRVRRRSVIHSCVAGWCGRRGRGEKQELVVLGGQEGFTKSSTTVLMQNMIVILSDLSD